MFMGLGRLRWQRLVPYSSNESKNESKVGKIRKMSYFCKLDFFDNSDKKIRYVSF